MKPQLKINKTKFKRPGSTLGVKRLLHGLAKSDLFDVTFHNESINVMRGETGTILFYNDKKIYLDFWEYPTPSHTMNVYNGNFDLIIKLQHTNINRNAFESFYNRKQMLQKISKEQRLNFLDKFTPWTFFPSAMMEAIEQNESIEAHSDITRKCFFCGKAWKVRHKMIKSLENQKIDCWRSDQGQKDKKALSDEEYLYNMRSSQYGLVLQGRSTRITDCKNRREIDYMMLKKTLLLPYEPYYYNALVPGKHFILIDENTEINSLENMYNINEIAMNGYEWYKNNASPEAIPKTFLKIMQDKFAE